MSAFYLWIPSKLASKRTQLDFVVTNGDGTEGVPDCKDFFNYLLELSGVTLKSYHVEIQSIRCNYYSEYLESDSWEDLWPVVWKLSYVFSKEVTPIWTYSEQFVGINKLFSCPMKLNESGEIDCSFISYFIDETKFSKAVKQLELQKDETGKLTTFGPTSFRKKKLFKIEIAFQKCNSDFFQSNGKAIQNILSIVKKNGGNFHFGKL